MAKDFSSSRMRTSGLIASGGIANTNVSLAVYSASISSDFDGGITKDSSLFDDVGTDVFLFVSGAKNSKVARDDSGNGLQGVSLFGGDVVISGTLYAERQVIEVDLASTGSLIVSGAISVSGSSTFRSGLVINEDGGQLASDDFRVETLNKENAIFVDASTNQVLILSGGGATSFNEATGEDVGFYVSGAIGSKGSINRGVSVFGGDLLISGALYTSGAVYRKAKTVEAASYTVAADDYQIYFDTTANAITATLPAVAKATSGREIVMKDLGKATSNSILITGSDVIDGVPNLTINKSFGTVTLSTNGNVNHGWFVLVSSGALSHA